MLKTLARPRRGQSATATGSSSMIARVRRAAAGAAGHGGHGHRQPGGDHRRLLADPAGGAAGPAAADGRSAAPPRPRPARSICRRSTACCWSACCCWSVIFQTSDDLGHGLRHRGDRHDAGRPRCLAFIVVRRMWKWPPDRHGAADRAAAWRWTWSFLARQPAEDPRRRLAAAGAAALALFAGHADLDARHADPVRQDPPRQPCR